MSCLRCLEAILGATSWLQTLEKPSLLVERLLDLPLDAGSRRAIVEACNQDQRPPGAYYGWYLEKKLAASLLRDACGDALLKALARFDQSDYTQLDSVLDSQRGSVIALPHYGHYIPSVIGIANHLSRYRDVAVFYADPGAHHGNAVFDGLHVAVFGNRNRRASVFHANREGLARALRFLNEGGVLLMFPDVYENLEESFSIPFLDRSLNVMLGSATLARRAQGYLIPALAVSPGGLRFATHFGEPVHAATDSRTSESDSLRTQALMRDYEATSSLFQWYERRMKGRLVCWQYIREHFAAQSHFTQLDAFSLDALWDSFMKDPRIAPPNYASLELHTPS